MLLVYSFHSNLGIGKISQGIVELCWALQKPLKNEFGRGVKRRGGYKAALASILNLCYSSDRLVCDDAILQKIKIFTAEDKIIISKGVLAY